MSTSRKVKIGEAEAKLLKVKYLHRICVESQDELNAANSLNLRRGALQRMLGYMDFDFESFIELSRNDLKLLFIYHNLGDDPNIEETSKELRVPVINCSICYLHKKTEKIDSVNAWGNVLACSAPYLNKLLETYKMTFKQFKESSEETLRNLSIKLEIDYDKPFIPLKPKRKNTATEKPKDGSKKRKRENTESKRENTKPREPKSRKHRKMGSTEIATKTTASDLVSLSIFHPNSPKNQAPTPPTPEGRYSNETRLGLFLSQIGGHDETPQKQIFRSILDEPMNDFIDDILTEANNARPQQK